MALPNDGIAPTPFELRIRFTFGALFGLLVGAGVLLRLGVTSVGPLLLSATAGALGAGLLSRHFGDRFWRSFLRWLPF